MKIKAAKELMWMLPYLKESYKFLPPGTKITRLGSWKRGKRYGNEVVASIFTNDDQNFRVYLQLYKSCNTAKEDKFTKSELLKNLAHELAHVIEMREHNLKHKRLEKRLVRHFLQMNHKKRLSSFWRKYDLPVQTHKHLN